MQHDKLHHYAPHDRVYTSRTGRFAFDLLDNLRKNFCHSFCMSADNMPYFTNLMCAIKCPELYLPHSTTTPTSMLTPTSSIITTIGIKNIYCYTENKYLFLKIYPLFINHLSFKNIRNITT